MYFEDLAILLHHLIMLEMTVRHTSILKPGIRNLRDKSCRAFYFLKYLEYNIIRVIESLFLDEYSVVHLL